MLGKCRLEFRSGDKIAHDRTRLGQLRNRCELFSTIATRFAQQMPRDDLGKQMVRGCTGMLEQ